MGKQLSDYLRTIGLEIHDTSYADEDGALRPITRDEALAREVWKRALGYEEEMENADGVMQHRIHLPDPKAQQFIFERREGKIVVPVDDNGISLVERITEITKAQVNKIAEQSIDDRDPDQSES